MRVFWLSPVRPPDPRNAEVSKGGGGWIGASLENLLKVDPSLEFLVYCPGARKLDYTIGPVRYMTSGYPPKTYYRKIPTALKTDISKAIREFKPDVIHIHGTEYFYGALDWSAYHGVPTVVSIQGVVSGLHPYLMGGLSPAETWWTKFTLRLLKSGTTLLRTQTFWREKWAKQEERIFRAHHNFIGRTSFDYAWMRFYNPNARYFPVNETMRVPFYKVRRIREDVVPHTIFCGGAAGYPLKGAHWLIRAVAAVKQSYPDVQLRIAAAYPRLSLCRSFASWLRDDAYARYLRRLIMDLGLQGNVIALPLLDAAQVAEELKKAEVFVLPSLGENSPNSLGEAQLVGTPAIATYVGGVPSVSDSDGCLFVPSCDPAMLAEAIRNLFAHPADADAMAFRARERAMKRYDSRHNAEATRAVYRCVADLKE